MIVDECVFIREHFGRNPPFLKEMFVWRRLSPRVGMSLASICKRMMKQAELHILFQPGCQALVGRHRWENLHLKLIRLSSALPSGMSLNRLRLINPS
jgi:hypothetical protein